jgi:hypothetical protein
MNLKQHFLLVSEISFFVDIDHRNFMMSASLDWCVNTFVLLTRTIAFGSWCPLNNDDDPIPFCTYPFPSQIRFAPGCRFALDSFCNRLQLKRHFQTGREVWLLNPNAETPYIIRNLLFLHGYLCSLVTSSKERQILLKRYRCLRYSKGFIIFFFYSSAAKWQLIWGNLQILKV